MGGYLMNIDSSEFKKRYDATILPSNQQHIRYSALRHPQDYSSSGEMHDSLLNIQKVPMVKIHIPEDRFRALLEIEAVQRRLMNSSIKVGSHPGDKMWDNYIRECKIRYQCPALMIAYEKYQSVLALVDGHYD
jgi:hypothetical protein